MKSALGLGGRGTADDPWHSMVGEAHPLDELSRILGDGVDQAAW
jgi:hypothetical protein